MSPYSCSIFLMSSMIPVIIGFESFHLIQNNELHRNHTEMKHNQINL